MLENSKAEYGQKVATLSRQLSWSHFLVLLPIEDETKLDFYAVMCSNENWSVRTLRERRKSMLFERTAISKKPEETIKNELQTLQTESKMSPDLFYKDPYILDFLGLKISFLRWGLTCIFNQNNLKLVVNASDDEQLEN